ncbi:MAG TPA: PTS sugar transporter subunit IIA [Gemmatimonadales bacterium]|nr:PTS sugar transporter subunit IIA [Gemmatimonadales bacterium]
MLLTDLLHPDRVRVPLAATDKPGVLRELTSLLAERTGAGAEELLHAVEEREAVLSTGIGLGVAVPHGKTPAVAALEMACGVTAAPVPFDALDGEPCRLFFLLVGPESAAGEHVKALSRIARLVRREDVRQQLLAATTPEAFVRAVADAEAR